ncbi:MAG: ferritin [Anaerolineae bacterium]|jgi:ferritin
MELGKNLQDAINEQIREELASGYIYLAMAAYFEDQNLSGFAHWMKVQSQEELAHAMKFYAHVHERGGRVLLQALPEPPLEFEGPLDVFQQALEHERYISSRIIDLFKLAQKEGEYASYSLLQWFVDEQVEEEENATQIVDLLKLAGEKGQALIMLDRQLAQRGG